MTTFIAFVHHMSLVQQGIFNGNTLKTKNSSNKTQRTNKKPQNTTLTELRESIIISLSSDNIFMPTEKYLGFFIAEMEWHYAILPKQKDNPTS